MVCICVVVVEGQVLVFQAVAARGGMGCPGEQCSERTVQPELSGTGFMPDTAGGPHRLAACRYQNKAGAQ